MRAMKAQKPVSRKDAKTAQELRDATRPGIVYPLCYSGHKKARFYSRLETTPMELDGLSIAAHPDDTDLTCGGAVLKMAPAGYRAGALDLTAREKGTQGNPERTNREARRADGV